MAAEVDGIGQDGLARSETGDDPVTIDPTADPDPAPLLSPERAPPDDHGPAGDGDRAEREVGRLLDALRAADTQDEWDASARRLEDFVAAHPAAIGAAAVAEALRDADPGLIVDLGARLLPMIDGPDVLSLAMARASVSLGDLKSAERFLAPLDRGTLGAEAGRIRAELRFLAGDEPGGIMALSLAEENGLTEAFDAASERTEAALAAAHRTEDVEAWHHAAEALAALGHCWPRRAGTMMAEAARCYRRAGFPKKAVALYRTMAADDPAVKVAAVLGIVDTLLETGCWDEAVDHLRKEARDGDLILKRRLHALLRDSGRVGGPLPRSRGEAMPSINGGVAERTLLNRLTSNMPPSELIGSLDHETHVPASEWGFDDVQSARFDQVGWLEMLREGRREPLLVGVVSVRGRILSDRVLTTVDLTFGDEVVVADEPLALVRHMGGRILYAFNIWFDAGRVAPARGELCAWATNDIGGILTATVVANVTRAPASFEPMASDSFVASVGDGADVEAEVLARPCFVRPSMRPLFVGEVREVLAMRVDQLGDLSATLPAIRRLRELFPDARLTALVATGLRDIVAATGLCDEVLGLTLVYDHVSERRYLPSAEQARLSSLSDHHNFDIAIDFCPADETRALLRLVNATYLVGFNPREFKYLDLGVDIFTRDKFNQASIISHSAYVSVLVEALAVAIRPTQGVVERRRDDTAALARIGVRPGGYVVIHSGARHQINCWPFDRFVELANRIAREQGHRVVFFADRRDAVWDGDARVTMAGTMTTDLFDAVIANAMLMIGNDSGPKHLAAVHGVKTVSVHINRLNWREWGQDGEGVIISKKVPCCGCGLNNLAMCAKDAACITSITVDDVFDAVVDQLAEKGRGADRHGELTQ